MHYFIFIIDFINNKRTVNYEKLISGVIIWISPKNLIMVLFKDTSIIVYR